MAEHTIQFVSPRRFYDTATVAETHRRLLAEGHNISENALRGLIRQGILPAVKIGRQVAVVLSQRTQAVDGGHRFCFP